MYNDPEGIRDAIAAHGLSCQIHSPICDWNIAAMSGRLREASVKETIATIDAADAMGVRTVTVHPGLTSMAIPGLEDRAVEHAKASMRTIDRIASEYGITAAIENMPAFPFFLGKSAEQLNEIVDGTDLSICFDIGHANTTGQIDAMIDTLGDRIANIHIHDNHGSADEHLTIGDGTIDFRPIIERLSGYRGNWIIESKSLESAVQSLSRLRGMLS